MKQEICTVVCARQKKNEKNERKIWKNGCRIIVCRQVNSIDRFNRFVYCLCCVAKCIFHACEARDIEKWQRVCQHLFFLHFCFCFFFFYFIFLFCVFYSSIRVRTYVRSNWFNVIYSIVFSRTKQICGSTMRRRKHWIITWHSYIVKRRRSSNRTAVSHTRKENVLREQHRKGSSRDRYR